MEGLKLACGRELMLRRSCSASAVLVGGERLGLEPFSKPLLPPFTRSRNISMAVTANSVTKRSFGTNCNLRSRQRRGRQTLLTSPSSYRASSRWNLARSTGVMSNQVQYRRLTQIERHLHPKPWTATRTVYMSSASGGTPSHESLIGKIIEKLIQIIVSLLPSKALVEKVEEEIDTISGVVKQSMEVVIEVADEVEKFSNIAEMKAEEVEKLAQKVEKITEELKEVVDNVADVLEGEKGASSLVDIYQNLQNDASAAAATAQKLETRTHSGTDDSGVASSTTPLH